MSEDYRYSRFLDAQAPVYESVVEELRSGTKSSHWMWFIFPQLAALGRSSTAKYYGIGSGAEAAAYQAHPVLGSRLVECTELVLEHRGRPLTWIFGEIDAMKFRSSMTLFEAVGGKPSIFRQALDNFCAGARDRKTLELLGEAP